MPSLLRPVINDVWMGAGVITILSSGESLVSEFMALSDVYLCDLLITRVQWFRSGYAIMGEERAPRLCRELPHSKFRKKSEQFGLKWNDFQSNVSKSFGVCRFFAGSETSSMSTREELIKKIWGNFYGYSILIMIY